MGAVDPSTSASCGGGLQRRVSHLQESVCLFLLRHSVISFSLRNLGLGSRADIATLGLAISLVTSASVSLSSCSWFSLASDVLILGALQLE
jgi:hypothetical protein